MSVSRDKEATILSITKITLQQVSLLLINSPDLERAQMVKVFQPMIVYFYREIWPTDLDTNRDTPSITYNN
jgi:hypothetical protein